MDYDNEDNPKASSNACLIICCGVKHKLYLRVTHQTFLRQSLRDIKAAQSFLSTLYYKTSWYTTLHSCCAVRLPFVICLKILV
jgi:hypothetical protein